MNIFPEITTGSLLLLVAAATYLFGSLPFGVIYARAFGLPDPRQIGSGNIGATNVLRSGNKLAAFLTLISDAGKGAVAVLVARALYAEDAAQIAGFAAFVGHLFPIWLGFKGGKGVATFLGTILAISFPVGLAACGTWLVVAIVSRISSLSALISVALAPVWMWILGYPTGMALGIALAVLVWFKHAANIKRILSGAEPRIGQK